ncbi:ATPase [Spirochaetia bacterium]|nr:ATPase [Spirochaetia bacterium]
MDFCDREEEQAALERNRMQAEKTGLFTLMIGRRRIGKTALLLESVRGHRYLYLFVSRKTEALLCAQFQKEAEHYLGFRSFGEIRGFRDLFEGLLLFAEKTPFTLIIDEFQDLERINPAIFSEIQDLWDRYRQKSRINFIACGSVYSLMMKIFENGKEPLFGRADSKFVIRPFKIAVIKEILASYHARYNSEDLLCLYLLSGGVPRYISILMDAGAVTRAKMLKAVCAMDSPFLGEGRELLVSEFGRDYGTYFSILQLIARGKTTQTEVDSIIGKNTGSYLAALERDYCLIQKHKPLFSKPESRNARWKIDDNYLRFYFRFIYPNQTLIETGRNAALLELIEQNYDTYSGLVLEQYFKTKMSEEGSALIGSWWDRKGENEIDLIAYNKTEKSALLAEVKRNPKKINVSVLEGKARSLTELSGCRLEYRGLSLKDM